MSELALDVRRSVQIVRRRKLLVGLLVALGLLAGAAYAVLRPPVLTSTALIVIPQSVSSANAQSTTPNTVSPYTATQMVIARSNPVLSAALPNVRPAMSLDELRNEVQVSGLTSYIISVSVTSKVAADAEQTANAVADSYISYVNSPTSPIPHVSARILQPATSTTRKNPLEELLIKALIGALAGVVIGVIVSLAIGRGDRRLRERDEIASSIGVPVLASFPVRHPKDPAGWTALLEDYEPGARDAWRMRQALQHLEMADVSVNSQVLGDGNDGSGSSLAVVSLSADPGAVALGPQLAVFAASLGIPTALVIGPQQDAVATATLRTACAMSPPVPSKRPGDLRVVVDDNADFNSVFDAALTVVVAVVDGRSPRMPDTMRTTATVLGVSAGAATAEQIARAAVSAAADGRGITGILVADPEPADTTTGLVPQLARPGRRRLPARLSGRVTEIRR